ncbi:uracil-DNA glycosylase-like protein [Russula brevipes]|nr:uracil-DNA glycosylase-like protein [Russula brevipes]
MPSPPSFSARRPTFDTGAQSQNGARSPDGLDIIDDSSPGSSLGPVKVVASQKRKGRETRSLSPKKQRVGYVAPDVYAHLQGVQDHVAEDLDVLFCGINPGHMSAAQGHHYANPTNHFWRCLFLSGFTPRRLLASEDSTLPEAYNLGLTNLVERPSASQAELSNREMADSAPALLAKVARLRPRVVCFIGKGIWLRVERSLLQRTRNNSEDRPGFRGGPGARATEATSASVNETLFCVFPSTSGRVVSHQLGDKVALFKLLRENLEHIKAGTLDTSSMRLVRL